jgi:YgiT-type zinc finger domain-containing protein
MNLTPLSGRIIASGGKPMHEPCAVCGGKLRQRLTTYTQEYDSRLVVVENVPAWVCDQCGETYFDPEVVEQVQALIWSGAKPARVIETPVYDLNAVT